MKPLPSLLATTILLSACSGNIDNSPESGGQGYKSVSAGLSLWIFLDFSHNCAMPTAHPSLKWRMAVVIFSFVAILMKEK